jgi:hypothetical protein
MAAHVLGYLSLPETIRTEAMAPPAATHDDRTEIVVRHGNGASDVRPIPVEAAKLITRMRPDDRLSAVGQARR